MRSLSILVLFFYSNLSLAADYVVKCESPGITTQNQFELSGEVSVDEEGNIANGKFLVELRERGKDSQWIEYNFELPGTYKLLPAGSYYVHDVHYFQMFKKDNAVELVKILAEDKGPLSSSLRLSNGVLFKSRCFLLN